jgi:hypothetical protein
MLRYFPPHMQARLGHCGSRSLPPNFKPSKGPGNSLSSENLPKLSRKPWTKLPQTLDKVTESSPHDYRHSARVRNAQPILSSVFESGHNEIT